MHWMWDQSTQYILNNISVTATKSSHFTQLHRGVVVCAYTTVEVEMRKGGVDMYMPMKTTS